MSEFINVKVKKLDILAKLPTKATSSAACWDLYIVEGGLITKDVITILPTGLAMEIPEGYELQIRPRSGLSTKGVTLVNSPATIDSDYRGEIKIILTSLAESYLARHGERIAQCCLRKLEDYSFIETTSNLSPTSRGTTGLGNSGKY